VPCGTFRGQLTELRSAELRFTPGEAAALLQQVAAAPGAVRLGVPLPDAVAAALAARTESWAAGLQLAGLSRSTSATSWASSARPTAPRPSPAHASSA